MSTSAQPGELPPYLAQFANYIVVDSPAVRIARRASGILALIICIALIILHFMLRDSVRFNKTGLPAWSITGLDWIVIACNYFVFVFASSMFARNAITVLNRASGPPVLFLRSFAADVRVGAGSEYELERALRPLGPLVAVGLPNEHVPPVGAARLYIGDEKWQDVVTQLMLEARVIVLRIGETQGFWWEVRECVRLGKPEKLLIVLLPGDTSSVYEQFRQEARRILPTELPPLERGALFLAFDADWRPHFLGVTGRWVTMRRLFFKAPLAVALRDAVRGKYSVAHIRMTVNEWAAVVAIVMSVISLVYYIYEWARLKAVTRALITPEDR